MSKYPECERCKDEHTSICKTCLPVDPVEITREDAIEYFIEQNELFKKRLGEKARIITEYRMNYLAIMALEKMEP